jgi:Ras GTPase-activating-like protein IQGAP2/3
MLQNLANKPSYAKETYMIPTNPFVEKNKQRINRFLNDLCEVGDFYESLEMDQYMALSKKDIVLNITLNEIYNTHALLQQHIDVLAPKKDDHLRILLTEAGSAPAQVPRKQNLPIVLPLFSRWETPIQGKPVGIWLCMSTTTKKKKWGHGILTLAFHTRSDNGVNVGEQYHPK